MANKLQDKIPELPKLDLSGYSEQDLADFAGIEMYDEEGGVIELLTPKDRKAVDAAVKSVAKKAEAAAKEQKAKMAKAIASGDEKAIFEAL